MLQCTLGNFTGFSELSKLVFRYIAIAQKGVQDCCTRLTVLSHTICLPFAVHTDTSHADGRRALRSGQQLQVKPVDQSYCARVTLPGNCSFLIIVLFSIRFLVLLHVVRKQ
jgi:hypothetical protein